MGQKDNGGIDHQFNGREEIRTSFFADEAVPIVLHDQTRGRFSGQGTRNSHFPYCTVDTNTNATLLLLTPKKNRTQPITSSRTFSFRSSRIASVRRFSSLAWQIKGVSWGGEEGKDSRGQCSGGLGNKTKRGVASAY
jgi:hypothetical protein